MRKITQLSIIAFLNAEPFCLNNTIVEVEPNVTILKLHNNPIAYKYNDPKQTISITNAGWETNTTKERLNAIPGVEIQQINFQWYLNGNLWDGSLTEIYSL